MSERLAEAIKHVRNILQEEEHDHCATVKIFFNCQGYEVTRSLRSPGSLKRDGISMRNIKGEFIK